MLNLLWFKRDLRVQDNGALQAALASGHHVLPLYIIEPEYWRLPDVSRRHWHFLQESLVGLQRNLRAIGSNLCIRNGSVLEVLEGLRQHYGTFTLFSHEETGNAWTFARDKQVAAYCNAQGILWHETPSHGVVRQLPSRDGWAAQRDARMAAPQIPAPTRITSPQEITWGEIPSKHHSLFGSSAIGNVQEGGRESGLRVLNSFLTERCRRYMTTISKPGVSARHCSRLSAHIAYGTLSVKEVEQATKAKLHSLNHNPDPEAVQMARNLSAFLLRLAWRCHFVQKLEQQPRIETHCMHPAFEGMREPYFNEQFFEAWKTGSTGYPLVDACIRSLHENGWITFRMRAMLVSFASYHLWLDWRQTAPFLAQLFTDYEPGIHYSQFQMQSGVTGINAVRMYNPIKQSQDHDPEGKFIRRFVPELRDISPQWIHEPWRMEKPPKHYPAPIVDHEAGIKFARNEISKRWKGEHFREEARAVNQKLGSRNKQPARRQVKPKASPKNTQLSLEI